MQDNRFNQFFLEEEGKGLSWLSWWYAYTTIETSQIFKLNIKMWGNIHEFIFSLGKDI